VFEDRSPHNNRNTDGPPRKAFDLTEAVDASHGEPSYHAHLLDSYTQRCLAGVGRQGALVSSAHDFSVDDRYAFRMLSEFVAGDIQATVDFHGPVAAKLGITPRFLHHRVVRDSAYDEHHVFVELHDKELRPVVASRGCLQVFSAGPIAHHYILSDRSSISEYRLVSRPAFVEATTSLYRSEVVSAFHTWAYSWLLEGFQGATHAALRPDNDWRQSIKDVRHVEQGLRSLTPLGAPKEPDFVVEYEDQRYRMNLRLDSRLSVPVCYRAPGQVI
jgi:hypothetical protein